MDTTEIAAFLQRFPPFDALPPDELAAVAGAAELRHYANGENVLVEDARPAQHLFVVHEGSVELVHEGEVVDILEPGESFGHPSLLTGLAPAFTVRAHEEGTSCFLIPREAAIRALASPAGTSFVATTLRERLTRTGHTVHALPPVNTVSVGDLVRRPPVFCTGDVTIHKAARLMTENGVSAILIRDGRTHSIVTDALLRERVLAEEFAGGNPVMRVAAPAVTVRPDDLAVDAVVEMLDAGTDHVVVTRDGEAVGLLSAADLLGLESRSPFALRHALLRAHDEDELVETAKDLGQLLLALVEADLPPEKIGRVLTLQLDTITARLIDFAIERHGLAPVPWAWLQLGSTARRELTLGSDQENALAYADSDDGTTHDAYFERFADEVNEGLARCGFPPDANDVLARNRLWRMSQSDWLRVFGEAIESPDESHLIRATVAFDFRHAGGGLEIVPPLVAMLRRAPEFPDFVRQLARSATGFKPPLGFRGALPGGRKKSDRVIDIKRGGAIPIANLARFYALTNGVTISATLDRLVAAQETGALDTETATGLREAFAVVARCRLLHHAQQIEAGVTPDNLIDPAELPPLARTELREAFRVVAHAQKGLSAYVPLGL